MASLEQTIKLVLAAEDRGSAIIKKFGENVESVGGNLGQLNDSIGDITAPFADLAGGVLKADAALGALAVGGLAYAFSKSKDFESASIELKKVLGDFPDALAEAERVAKNLSGTYGQSSAEILLSTANFKQAGFDVNDAMLLTKDAMDLVIAGSLDASQASDLLIASLKGFDLPATDAARLIDVLNEVSNNYATDVEQLAIGMAELSPIASTMGFSLEETAGVLTPVIEIFRSGGEAAVALKTGLLRLLDDNPTVVRALESIGVAQRDANGNLRSGKEILADVATAFTSLDQKQKLFIASQLVGIEQSARMVTVFDNLGKTTEVTETALRAAGSAAAEVASRLESSEVAVDRFVVGFENLAITVGDQFRDAAKGAIDGGTDIENALTGIIESGALDALFNALEDKLGQLGECRSGVAGNLPEAFDNVDFSGLLAGLGSIAEEIEDLFSGLDLNTPEGLAAAIQKVVDGISALENVTAGMISGAGPFIRTLLDMVDGFIQMDAENQKSIGSVTGFGAALNKLTEPVGAVLQSIEGIGTAMQVLAGVQIAKLVANLIGAAGLSGALSSVVSSAGSLIATLSGPAGVAAVVGASALAVGGAVKSYLDWQEAEAEAAKAADRSAASAAGLAEKYRDISKQTGENIDSTQTFHRLIDEGIILLDKQNGVWISAAEAQRDYSAEVAAASEESIDLAAATEDLARQMGFAVTETEKAAESLKLQKAAAIDASAAYYEFIGNTPEIARAMAAIEAEHPEKALQAIGESAKDAKGKSDELILGLEELASNEKIRTLALTVDFNIAQVDAQKETLIRTFDSIDASIASTGDQLTSLFGMFSDLGSSMGDVLKGRKISDQIDQENERRDKAFELQAKLTEAQTNFYNAQADRASSGESFITLDASGLVAEAEAFAMAVLRNLQIRMTELQSEFLIGLGL